MSDINTKTLLHFNGDNNATYIDDFGSDKVWTAGGTAKISTAIKKFGRGSLYLDGDTGYISTPDHDDFTLGLATGAFSFDLWLYLTSTPASTPSCIFSKVQDASNKYFAELYDNAGVSTFRFRVREGGVYINDFEWALPALTINTWNHFELTHSNGTLYLYRSGVLISSQAGFAECSNTTGAFEIGRHGGGTPTNYLSAYVDEFRYSQGIARHTSASFALSASGYRRAGVDDEYTAILLHPSSSAGAISVDSTGAILTDYRQSTSQATAETAQYKFAPSSVYCNGTTASKGLSAGSDGKLQRAKISFRTYATIDFWVRFTSFAAVQNFYGIASAAMPSILYDGTGANKRFGIYTTYLNIGSALATDTWYHVAFVKNAGNVTVYLNGTAQGVIAIGTAWDSYDTAAECAAQVFQLMANYNGACTAYFDEFRISPDIQRWTADFTPETAEYGAQIIEADFTETLTLNQTAQTTWDNESPKVGLSDIIDVVREVPYDEAPLATISDSMTIERDAHFSPEERSGISDDMTLILELEVLDSHAVGITDSFDAGIFISQPGINISLPSMKFYATGQDDSSGVLSFSVPKIGVLWSGSADPIGMLNVNLPRLGLSASGMIGQIGQINVVLPKISFSPSVAIGEAGTMSLSIPKLSFKLAGMSAIEGTLNITLPMSKITFVTYSSTYLSMVLNIKNNALTEFSGYDFNSMCRFNGKNLGASAGHIFDLDSGTMDNGSMIAWNFRIPYINLEVKKKKRISQAWLSMKSSGDLIVTLVQPNGNEYEYDADGYEVTEDGIRVVFGRGIKSQYVALDVKGVNGSDIRLDTMRLNFDTFNKER